MIDMEITKKYALYFLVLVYVSGSIGFVLKPSFFSLFTPYSLLLTGFVYLIHQPYKDKRFLFSFFAISVLGFLFEVIGVSTGLVFGNYTYGSGLGYCILDVPLIISLNWALIISASFSITKKHFDNKYALLFVASLLAVLIDFLIEQVAPKLDFWRFDSGMPGLHNYIGWFLISYLCGLLFYTPLTKSKFLPSYIILALQIQFFGIIYLFT